MNPNIKGEYQICISYLQTFSFMKGMKIPETYSEPSQIPKMEIFEKIVNSK